MCGCLGGATRGAEIPSVDLKATGVREPSRISGNGECTVIDGMSRWVRKQLCCYGELAVGRCRDYLKLRKVHTSRVIWMARTIELSSINRELARLAKYFASIVNVEFAFIYS